jgi:multidrug transporter EmrE-like cation transporter
MRVWVGKIHPHDPRLIQITMTDIFLIIINILLAVSGQTFIKQGMGKIGSFTEMPLVKFFQRSLLSPLVLLGLFLYIVSSLVWFMVLSRVDLSVAYPALSLGYILVLAIGFFFLGETITLTKLAGVVLICLGVFLIFKK